MNAVIYARYSSHNQTECSIEGQLQDCYAYAEREGYTVVGEYIDRALSGKYDDRPDFQRMIKDAAKRQFQYVLVWKLDRFARNRYDSAIYKHKLKQFNVRVLSVMECIGDNPESIILEAVLEASAEYYSIDLAKKINRGLRVAAQNGTYVGGPVPFGYVVEDRRLVVDPRKAEFVRAAYEQYAGGIGKKDIADYFNARGLRTSKGNKFTVNSLDSILTNSKYVGRYMYNGVEVAGGCPAIIDEKLFDRVQARIAFNHRAPAANRSDDVDYQLVGKAYCGVCGARLGAESGRGKCGGVYRYYACAAKKKNRAACQKLNEKQDFLEWYIAEQTIEYVLSPARIEAIAAAVVDQYDRDFNDTRIRDLEKLVASINAEIEESITAVTQTKIQKVKDRFMRRLEELEAQLTDVEIDLSKLRIANGVRFTTSEIRAWLRQFCTGDPCDLDFRRRLIDVFINTVYVYDDKIVIYYNVKEGKQVSYIDMIESSDLESLAPIPQKQKKSRTQEGSRLRLNGGAYAANLEPPRARYVFVGGTFGLVVFRD